MLQTSINELDKDDDVKYALFPGFQQRDRQPLPAILPPHDDIFQDADESQPLTSDSQQNTPQHMANQMMVTPAVSDASNISDLILFFLIKSNTFSYCSYQYWWWPLELLWGTHIFPRTHHQYFFSNWKKIVKFTLSKHQMHTLHIQIHIYLSLTVPFSYLHKFLSLIYFIVIIGAINTSHWRILYVRLCDRVCVCVCVLLYRTWFSQISI